MANILDDTFEVASDIKNMAAKYGQSANRLFGRKEQVPIHTEEPKSPQTEIPYQADGGYSESQLEAAKAALQNQLADTAFPSGFQKNKSIDYHDDYLMVMAELEVSRLLLGVDLKTEPLRLGLSFLFKKIGREDIATELQEVEDSEAIGKFRELLIQVQFEYMKNLQRNGELDVPKPSEMLGAHIQMKFAQIAGPGFKNVTALLEESYKKWGPKK